MKKKIILYIISFTLLAVTLLFFSSAYKALTADNELSNRHHTVQSIFQDLSRQVNNAAVIHPELIRSGSEMFFADSSSIVGQLNLLKATVHDSVNIRIAEQLSPLIKKELAWLLKSNVPDSVLYGKAINHVNAFKRINSLLTAGIDRTAFLISYRKAVVYNEIKKIRLIIIVFVLLAGTLLVITIVNFFKQESKANSKDKELATVLNRISDAVVSVDNNWRYTFLNDAAIAAHPLGKEGTLGKLIWEVHPQLKTTVFWDKYQEAMQTKKVVETENYYPPLNVWFAVKVYPSANGLTIFYKDVTERKTGEQKLAQSIKELTDYKVALDESSIVAITDQKGIIRHANQNFCIISKYTQEELIGQDHRIINSGHHPKEFIHNIWTTIANGKIWKGELKNKAKDGTIYWVDTTIVPFLNEKQKPYQYVAIRSDITERKLAEESLKKSLKEIADYKYALDESSIVAITDQKGIINYVNDNFCKISKYKTDELLGQDHRIINSGHHPKEFIRSIWTTIANGKIWKGELKNKAKDGTIYWVDTTIVPFLDENKKPYQYIAIRADITQRKEAEERIIKSEKIYKTIASSIPGSVICLLDTEFRYLLIEGDMLEKLGYSKDSLLGNKAKDVLPPEIFEPVQQEFKKVVEGATVTRESNRAGYDTISRYIPLKDEHDKVYAIMTVTIDVTDLKKAQRDIAELNRDLEAKIKIRTEQLKKSNEELEAFSYSVSHDLRAPLRGMIGFAAILEEDYGNKLDKEAARIITVIKDNTIKMGNLIDDLLAFSRTGKQELQKTTIDTREMVNEIINDIAHTNSSIIWKIKDLPEINADRNTIRQVWINLLSNAVKYSSNVQQPIIIIEAHNDKNEIIFSVKDNGVGFDEAYSDKLFKVFQRLHDAEEFEGTGVGLALVEKIISKHNGRVWAEGKPGHGAAFYFSLPR